MTGLDHRLGSARLGSCHRTASVIFSQPLALNSHQVDSDWISSCQIHHQPAMHRHSQVNHIEWSQVQSGLTCLKQWSFSHRMLGLSMSAQSDHMHSLKHIVLTPMQRSPECMQAS